MQIAKLIQLKPDERVIVVYRQYGLTCVGPIVLTFVLIVLPFFLLTPLFARGRFGIAVFAALLILALWYGLRQAMTWYYNLFVVTDRRVVDIDQHGYFDRTVSEIPHPKIQDVSYRVRGMMPTLFHYGTVTIQTAGNTANIELLRIKNPEEIVDLLNELRIATSTNYKLQTTN